MCHRKDRYGDQAKNTFILLQKDKIVSKHIKEDFATLTVHFLQLGQKMYNFNRNFAWKTTNLKYAGKIIEPG